MICHNYSFEWRHLAQNPFFMHATIGKEEGWKTLSFQRREAKLNRAIFHILALKGSQTRWDVHKGVKAQKGLKHTKYTNVLRRIRALEESGYLEKVGTRKIKTQPSSQTNLYQLTPRAHLAILLNQINLDSFTQKASQHTIITTLAALISYTTNQLQAQT